MQNLQKAATQTESMGWLKIFCGMCTLALGFSLIFWILPARQMVDGHTFPVDSFALIAMIFLATYSVFYGKYIFTVITTHTRYTGLILILFGIANLVYSFLGDAAILLSFALISVILHGFLFMWSSIDLLRESL